jgi:hypothetical protein
MPAAHTLEQDFAEEKEKTDGRLSQADCHRILGPMD